MKIINTDVRGWKHEQGQYVTGEGLVLSKKQIKEQCEYSSVPTTLVNIDDRFGLDTTLQVLRATSTGIERLLVSDDEKQEVEVGRWARPSYLKQLREADIAFHGRPKFPEAVIQRLKGDAA